MRWIPTKKKSFAAFEDTKQRQEKFIPEYLKKLKKIFKINRIMFFQLGELLLLFQNYQRIETLFLTFSIQDETCYNEV